MKFESGKLNSIKTQIQQILDKAEELENFYKEDILKVHPVYQKSAQNLIHYMALRSFEISELQDELREL
ncbi:MAG: hypothetical protein JW833_04960, partial [Prolixibacteraceae bacterium]|nr:hypothetical protein [Prolixibacteraceae bacterium]